MKTSQCAIVGHACPETSDTAALVYCPMWWETVWTNQDNGETRVEKGCGFRQLPVYLSETVRRANGAAVSAQQARDGAASIEDTLSKGFRAVALSIHARRGDAQDSLHLDHQSPAQGRAGADTGAPTSLQPDG